MKRPENRDLRAIGGRLAAALPIAALLITSGLAAAGCSATAVTPDKHTPRALDRYVAVRWGAWLHTAPNDKAQRAHNVIWAQQPYKVGHAEVYRLVHEGRHWFEIESLPGKFTGHCLGRNSLLSKLTLRLFVKRADVVLVARRRSRAHYNDGTYIEIAAGMPMQWIGKGNRRGQSLYAIKSGAYGLNSFFFDTITGASYAPAPLYKNTREALVLKKTAKLVFGGTGVVGKGKWAPRLYVQSMSTGTREPLVVVEYRCLKMRVKVAEEDITKPVQGGLGMLLGSAGGSRGGPDRLKLQPGTHRVDANAPVGVEVYGYAHYVSYGYPAGLRVGHAGLIEE